ncbi:hypothetical protein D3C76_1469610 [compost metagenome]
MTDDFEDSFIADRLLIPGFPGQVTIGSGVHFVADIVAAAVDDQNPRNLRVQGSKALQEFADLVVVGIRLGRRHC